MGGADSSIQYTYLFSMKGFQVLIEKEWLAFGHKFAERCGQSNCSSSEWSPIFLQWVECVLHITRQFPTAFQFNEAFLVRNLYYVTKTVSCHLCCYVILFVNSLKATGEFYRELLHSFMVVTPSYCTFIYFIPI